jgi:hypothetical protein
MKCIHYAGGVFLTGDRIADAVIEYAIALARAAWADRVDAPIVTDGRIGTVTLVLGPGSQLLIETVEDTRDDPTDDELVHDLIRRAELLPQPSPGRTRTA